MTMTGCQGLTFSSEIVWRSMTSKAVRCIVVQQSVMHAPEHQLLYRPETQFLLNAVDGVPGRHRLDPPRLRDPSVGHTLGEGDEYLPLASESDRPPLQHLPSFPAPSRNALNVLLTTFSGQIGARPGPRSAWLRAAAPCQSPSGGIRWRRRPRPPRRRPPPSRPLA